MTEFAGSVGGVVFSRRPGGESTLLAARLAEISREPTLSPASRNELHSLSRERDPRLLAEGLYHWARREEDADRVAGAARVYDLLASSSSNGMVEAGLRARAERRLAVLSGGGEFGDRVEFLSRRFVREATHPAAILGMASAGLVFTTTRAALLARLAATGRPVLGARALASLGAFTAEVPAFWATSKGLNEALAPGTQDWGLAQNLRDLAGLTLTLGALKLSGALAARGAAWAHRPDALGRATRLSGLTEISRRWVPQAGMFGGILLGHRLEASFGLRPETESGTAMVDSLALLLQFNIGGRLSQTLLGGNFRAYSRELELRGLRLETEATRKPGSDGWGWGGTPWFPTLALAAGTFRGGSRGAGSRGLDRAGSHIYAMSGGGEGFGEGISRLKPRTGRSADDRFEAPMPAGEILQALSGRSVRREIEAHLEAESREGLSDAELGGAVGEALSARLRDIVASSEYQALRVLMENPWDLDGARLPAWDSLPERLGEELDAAAELMQITQFALRSNQSALGQGVRDRLSPEEQVYYRELVALIPILKGPRLTLPQGDIARGSEVIGAEEVVLSHGTGDMSSLLKAILRQSRPGGRPWYARSFATDADARIVAGIRRDGRNPVFTKPVHHNYEHDIPIEAVHNQDPLATVLFRRVRVQFLNIPSVVLDRFFSESYVRHLPEGAVLVSAIGGLLNGGIDRPRLPYQFIRERLDRYGRDDVEIVSMAGYIPGDKLWRGEHVEVNLSTREDPARPGNPRPAAPLVARLLSGASGPTYIGDYLSATVSHWDHSNNLGKVAKNVFTLMVGYQAGRIAREVVEQQAGLSRQDPRYREVQELGHSRYARARRGVWEMMQGLLVNNEGIKPSRARYNQAVFNDFDSCSQIEFETLVDVTRRAAELPIREVSPAQIRDFLQGNVFSPDRHVASTRNPRRGIAQALYEIWADAGLPFAYEEVGPKVTAEGVDSLSPFLRFYSDSSLDIERRRLPNEVYELHRAFLGRAVQAPPRIGEYLRLAIDRNPEDVEAIDLQEGMRNIGLPPQRVRPLLEGSSEVGLRTLNREVRRLAALAHADSQRDPAEGTKRREEVQRQGELLRSLEQAMLRGDPERIIRSPVLLGPYENAFIIQRRDLDAGRTHQAFIRLRLEAVQSRLTSLGMFLRSFPPQDDVEVEIRIPDASLSASNYRQLYEVQQVTREITGAFRRHRTGALRLSLDRRAEEEEWGRPEPPTSVFYESLRPLASWVLGSAAADPGMAAVRDLFRHRRHETAEALDSALRAGTGWPMLMGPAPGPLQSGIRAMMTRPEKSVLMGVYSGEELVDTFAVFRYSAEEGRVLSHQLLRRFSEVLPERPEYGRPSALDYFQGMKVADFLRDYPVYAERQGFSIDRVRPVSIRYVPVEQGMVGNIPELNAGLLKLFLLRDSPESRDLLRRAEPLYELQPEVSRSRFVELAAPYLERYRAEQDRDLERNPMVRLFRRFAFLRRQR